MRCMVMQALVCPGQEAALAFEGGLELEEDHQCAYNLVLCAHALADTRAMRAAFERLAQVCKAPRCACKCATKLCLSSSCQAVHHASCHLSS